MDPTVAINQGICLHNVLLLLVHSWVLFLPEAGIKFPRGYLHASLTFTCISFFLPVFSLYGLRYKTLPGRGSSLSFKITYAVLNLLIINLPNLVIRSDGCVSVINEKCYGDHCWFL